MTNYQATLFRELLALLARERVEFIVVGGVAAFAYGASRLTADLDLVYRRTPQNLARLVAALAPHAPYPRGAPEGLPFKWDEQALRIGMNFTLRTSLGWVDLLGEIVGGGAYENLVPHAITITVHGTSCLCLDLDSLIRVKRAAGRPKNYDAIAELEAIREEREEKGRAD